MKAGNKFWSFDFEKADAVLQKQDPTFSIFEPIENLTKYVWYACRNPELSQCACTKTHLLIHELKKHGFHVKTPDVAIRETPDFKRTEIYDLGAHYEIPLWQSKCSKALLQNRNIDYVQFELRLQYSKDHDITLYRCAFDMVTAIKLLPNHNVKTIMLHAGSRQIPIAVKENTLTQMLPFPLYPGYVIYHNIFFRFLDEQDREVSKLSFSLCGGKFMTYNILEMPVRIYFFRNMGEYYFAAYQCNMLEIGKMKEQSSLTRQLPPNTHQYCDDMYTHTLHHEFAKFAV